MPVLPLRPALLVAALAVAGCDAATVEPPEAAPPRGEAVYEVTFDATWSAATHPEAFPAGAHFSPLAGAAHAPGVSLWSVGGAASDGLRDVAERGVTDALRAEVEALGGAAVYAEGGEVRRSPGEARWTVRVSDDRPEVSVVTMIAPSPDWFVGVDGLDLRDGDGWAERASVPLAVYDAGTDAGASYTAADAPVTPREPVALSGYGPLVGTAVGTLTARRVE